MQSTISLKRMKFFAYHGVLEQETKVGNTFYVDIQLHIDLSRAIESDELFDTINYAEVYEIVLVEMSVPSKLIEHVAGRILKRIKSEFSQVKIVEICVEKERPPMGGEVGFASIYLKE